MRKRLLAAFAIVVALASTLVADQTVISRFVSTRFLSNDGSASAPSFTFFSDPTSGFYKLAAGVIGTPSWIQQTPARSMLAADYTNATAGFTNTALSVTVKNGRKYTFQAILFLIDATAADGAQIDFNGGTATATNFRVHCVQFDQTNAGTGLLKSTQVTALASVASSVASTGTGQNIVSCNGTFEPSSNGTFIVRGAKVAVTAGNLTINRGSNLWVEDMP